jgi:hypothetical protein
MTEPRPSATGSCSSPHRPTNPSGASSLTIYAIDGEEPDDQDSLVELAVFRYATARHLTPARLRPLRVADEPVGAGLERTGELDQATIF